MDTETVRLKVTLPKELVETMNRVTEPRKRSRFIAEAVRQKIEQKEKEENEVNHEENNNITIRR